MTNTPCSGSRETTASTRRVCLLTEASGAGVGRHFLDLAYGLAAQGWKVTGVYSPGRMDTRFMARLHTAGPIHMVALPLHRNVHPLDAADLWRVMRLLRQYGPFDIVHGHSSKAGALARLTARWLGMPAVYTPHAFVTLSPTLPRWQLALYARIERQLRVSPRRLSPYPQMKRTMHVQSGSVRKRFISSPTALIVRRFRRARMPALGWDYRLESWSSALLAASHRKRRPTCCWTRSRWLSVGSRPPA